MHITLEADYAVRIMCCLHHGGCRMDARRLSEETQVTLRFALKILGKLVGAGIVRSYKGTQGGYELARPAAEITLQEILEAVEGPYYFSRCLAEGYDCPRNAQDTCCPHKVFGEITEMVREKLRSVTLERL